MEQRKIKVVGYVRVSTDKQADHGVSLDAQRAKIVGYAHLYEQELVEVIVDAGVSAKTLDRPGLQHALRMVRSGQADAILVAKLDRLTRSMRDLGTLVENELSNGKWALLSVADQLDTRSASGRLILNILGSVATWERDVISERTCEALAHKKALGKKTGGERPYGYRVGPDGNSLVVDGEEQIVVDAIRTARKAGFTQRAIVTDLAQRGITTRKGTSLGLRQVQRISARENIL